MAVFICIQKLPQKIAQILKQLQKEYKYARAVVLLGIYWEKYQNLLHIGTSTKSVTEMLTRKSYLEAIFFKTLRKLGTPIFCK